MAELRLTFSPHALIGAPTVKKVTVTQSKRVVFKIDGRSRTLEHRFNNVLDRHSYRFGDGVDYIESASRQGDIVTAHYRLYAGAQQTAVYTDFTTLPIFHYVAPGETAALDALGNDVVEVVPTFDNVLLAKQIRTRLTFAAHHFMRSLPPAVTPRLFSRHGDLMRDQSNASSAELIEIKRYDNTCNYFRGLIGFMWRECGRLIDRAKTPPVGDAPVKTMAQLEALVDVLETSLMGQPAHLEHGSHAAGGRTNDPHVLHWLADHDQSAWSSKFTERQMWSAYPDASAAELVYDIKAQHTNESGVVDTTALASEESKIYITSFREAALSGARELGFSDTSIYIP